MATPLRTPPAPEIIRFRRDGLTLVDHGTERKIVIHWPPDDKNPGQHVLFRNGTLPGEERHFDFEAENDLRGKSGDSFAHSVRGRFVASRKAWKIEYEYWLITSREPQLHSIIFHVDAVVDRIEKIKYPLILPSNRRMFVLFGGGVVAAVVLTFLVLWFLTGTGY
jgi:hypothetical protein